MRCLPDSACQKTTPNGTGARPTVGVAEPMTNYENQPLEGSGAAEQITIDARDVLAGHWDETRMEAGR